MRLLFAFLVATVALSATVQAEDVAPAPTPAAVINQQDLGELNKILTEQVPAKWAQPMADWVNKLVARQQADAKKAADTAKPADQKPN